MLLAVDIGNTQEKFAVFEDGKLVFSSLSVNGPFTAANGPLESANGHFTFTKRPLTEMVNNLAEVFNNKTFSIGHCVLSSVRKEEETNRIVDALQRFCPVMQVTSSVPLPFKSAYKSSALGIDRIAAVAGAKDLFDNSFLVIDAGTCITYDYLDADNTYSGGAIAPGMRIKFESLHNFTANLPLVKIIEKTELCADTTEKCIASGVINGTVAEIEQTIRNYKEKFGEISVVLTGGDGEFINGELKNKAIVEKNLVLRGLKNIYEFNV